jgi:aminoglycoside phosphotransferase (APT) family kinase protein
MPTKTSPDTIRAEKQVIASLLNMPSTQGIAFNDTGWDNRIYILRDGEVVFKFPRSAAVQKQYPYEIAGYKLLSTIESSVSTPHVNWEHPHNDYVGYKGVVGVSLDTIDQTLSNEQRHTLGTKLGEFLKNLHTLDLPNAPIVDVDEEVKRLLFRFKEDASTIATVFNENDYAQLESYIHTTLPKQMKELGTDAVLCHGDLGYWNIVYGPAGQVGVIDLGDLGYYDSSKDFIGFADETVLEAALAAYGDTPLLRQKIALRKVLLAIFDLAFYVNKHDDRRAAMARQLIESAI